MDFVSGRISCAICQHIARVRKRSLRQSSKLIALVIGWLSLICRTYIKHFMDDLPNDVIYIPCRVFSDHSMALKDHYVLLHYT